MDTMETAGRSLASRRRLARKREANRAHLAGEGLKVSAKQPEYGRLRLNDGSCVRLRPEHPIHLWSYDSVEDRTPMSHAMSRGAAEATGKPG